MRQRRGRRERGAQPNGPSPGQPTAASSAEPATRPDLPVSPPSPPGAYGPPPGGYSPPGPQPSNDPGYNYQPADPWRYGSHAPDGTWRRHDSRPDAPWDPPRSQPLPSTARQPFEPPPRYDPRQPFEPPRPEQRQSAWPYDTWFGPSPMPSTQSQPNPSQPTQYQPSQVQLPQPQPTGRRAARAQRSPKRRRKGRLIAIVTVVVVFVLAVGAAGGGYLLLHTHGSPSQTAARYLSAWERGDYRAMDRLSVNGPRGGLARPLTRARAQLGVHHANLTLGRVTTSGNTALARFTVTDELASGHVWTYQDQLSLVVKNRHWWVNWSPAAIYPGLRAGERFSLRAQWPARAQILADDGTVLSSAAAIGQSGSIGLLIGVVGPATKGQAKALGAPYRAGDEIGLSGIEQTYQKQLAGLPSLTIRILGPGKHVDATAARFAAQRGRPVRTSLNLSVQLAASEAVSSAKTRKPVDMVAMSASTGRVLAVVERPGGFDRALQGIFPPGSTFKIVTASALARTGLTPASAVQCPSQVNIGGRIFHNDKNEHYGTTDLLTAFAVSCNSTFALLATQRLTGGSLGSMARTFGYNTTPNLGLPATLGHFTRPHDPVDLAADAFGQGTDLVNPLSQASEVAAIDSGVWRPPTLVISPKPHQRAKPHVLSPAILNTLRPMMRAVVTIGTAAGVGFPAGVYGKTGTAEYLNGTKLASHGWFIGYRGDIAFAVLVEGGGYGADSAGPIANAFLRKL